LAVLDRGLQAQFAGTAGEALLQADLDMGGLVLAPLAEHLLAPRAGTAPGIAEIIPAGAAKAPPKEAGEEVAEAARVAGAAGVEVKLPVGATPAGWRPEFLARPPLISQVIVGRPLFRVLQDLVGLVDLLEPGFRVRLLADVRVKLARQLTVGLLDSRLGGVARHPQGLVIVFVLHCACRPKGEDGPPASAGPWPMNRVCSTHSI
jgi:hypothetical protein